MTVPVLLGRRGPLCLTPAAAHRLTLEPLRSNGTRLPWAAITLLRIPMPASRAPPACCYTMNRGRLIAVAIVHVGFESFNRAPGKCGSMSSRHLRLAQQAPVICGGLMTAYAYIASICDAYFCRDRLALQLHRRASARRRRAASPSPRTVNFLMPSTFETWSLVSSTPRWTSVAHRVVLGERLQRRVLDALPRGPDGRDVGVEHDQRGQERLPSPITQAVPISGCAFSFDSRFAGEMFLPAALMISSFLRSTIFR